MKKLFSLFLSFIILLSLIILPNSAFAAEYKPDVELYSPVYMLINLDDSSYPVIVEKNKDKKMYPASLTKIVTAMVTLENAKDLSAKVTYSKKASDYLAGSGAQVAGLAVGETASVEQMLYLTMVQSACDATEALAEYIGGTRENFVKMMNDYVKSLGCKNTHFVNPDGLHDPNHYSTASDLSKVTLKALKNSTFVKIADTVQYKYKNTTYYHTNLMLRSAYVSYYYEYASGIKTGSTTEAGYNVITTASKDGYNYLAIVMGSPVLDYNKDGYDEKCSFIDAASLFKWAFASLKYATVVRQNQVLDEVPVNNGRNDDSLSLVPSKDLTTIVPASFDTSTMIVKTDKPASVNAPVKKGQKICTATIYSSQKPIAKVNLVASKDVELSVFLTIINAIKLFFSNTIVKIVVALLFAGFLIYAGVLIGSNVKRSNRKKTHKNNGADKD